MKKREYTDEESNELDGFLSNGFYYGIYEELCGVDDHRMQGVFEPLEFFRLFSAQIEFIDENKDKPLLVAKHLRALSLDSEQKEYIYYQLRKLYEHEKKTDETLHAVCRELYKLRGELDLDLEDKILDLKAPGSYNFDHVLTALENLRTHEEQIAFLIEKRAMYQQNVDPVLEWENPTYAEKCTIEIEKRQDLQSLKTLGGIEEEKLSSELVQSEKTDGSRVGEREARQERRGLERESAFLFFEYLFEYANREVNLRVTNETRAIVVEFLTGYSYKKTKNVPAWVKKQKAIASEKEEIDEKFFRVMETVRKYFGLLGLQDVADKIAADLENDS